MNMMSSEEVRTDNGHCLRSFLYWSGWGSLDHEGAHSALGWNDLGGHSTILLLGGGVHSTLRQRSMHQNDAV